MAGGVSSVQIAQMYVVAVPVGTKSCAFSPTVSYYSRHDLVPIVPQSVILFY